MFTSKMITTITLLMITAIGGANIVKRDTNTDLSPSTALEHFKGDATYYDPSVGVGACGKKNVGSDFVVAVAPDIFNKGTNCGKVATLTYNGKTATATLVDNCAGCKHNDIDLSTAVFLQLAPLESGRLHNVEWDLN